jgi:hypothetical protein
VVTAQKLGEYASAREAARGAAEALLAFDAGKDLGQQQTKAILLRRLHAALADVELETGHLEPAESHLRLATEALQNVSLPGRFAAEVHQRDLALWSMTLARLGRTEEARPKSAQALAALRTLLADPGDDQEHKVFLTTALVAAAWVDTERSKALLAEAQQTVDSMPAELRAAKVGRQLETMILEARRGQR